MTTTSRDVERQHVAGAETVGEEAAGELAQGVGQEEGAEDEGRLVLGQAEARLDVAVGRAQAVAVQVRTATSVAMRRTRYAHGLAEPPSRWTWTNPAVWARGRVNAPMAGRVGLALLPGR